MPRKPETKPQKEWDDVDSPPLTDEQLKRMRPAIEVVPELVEEYRKSRGKQKDPLKEAVSLRLDPEIIEHFKKGGKGWQTRINDALKSFIKS